MDYSSQPPGRHLHFGAALAVQLRRALGDYCEQSGVLYTALLEEGGTLCADSGDDSLRDSGETAALAVGAFAAFRLVAERLGDEGFEGLLHEGPRRQFSLMPVTSRFLLLSVFQPPVRFAVVKICAKNVIARLSDPLELLTLSVAPRQPFSETGPRADSQKSDPPTAAGGESRTAPAADEGPDQPSVSPAPAHESPQAPSTQPPPPTETPSGRPSTSSGRAGFEPSDWVLGPESHFPWD
jgi:hypothetical protein